MPTREAIVIRPGNRFAATGLQGMAKRYDVSAVRARTLEKFLSFIPAPAAPVGPGGSAKSCGGRRGTARDRAA